MTPSARDNSGAVRSGAAVSALGATRAVVARAGRALGAQRAVALGVRGALVGAVLAAAGVTLARGMGWEPDIAGLGALGTLAALAGVTIALPAAIGAAWGWARRPHELECARWLDERAGTQSRLASALELAGREGPFEAVLREESEREALALDLRRVLPPVWERQTRVVVAWAAGLALAAGVSLAFMPAWREHPRARQLAESSAQRQQAIAQVREAAEAVKSLPTPRADPAIERELEALRQIEEELAAGSGRSEQARAESAARLESIAQQLDERAQASGTRAREVRESLRSAARAASRAQATGQPAASGSAQDGTLAPDAQQAPDERPESFAESLERSLAEGELADAARRLEELASRVNEMSPEERRALSQELRELSDSLDRQAQQQRPAEQRSTDQPSDQRPAGSPEQSTPERTPGKDDVADRASKAPSDLRAPEREPSESAEPGERESAEDLQRLRDTLRRAAEDLNTPADAKQNPPASPGENSPERPNREQSRQQNRPQSGQQNGQPSSTQSGEQRRPESNSPGEQSAERREPQQGSPPREGQGSTSPSSPSAGQAPAPPSGPTPERSREDSRAAEGNNRSPAQPPESRGEKTPEAQGSGSSQKARDPREAQRPPDDARGGAAERNPSPGEQERRESGGVSGPRDQQTPPTPGAERAPQRGIEELARQIDQMSREQQSAERDAESAERLRRQAEELLKNASPEELRKLREMAERMEREGADSPQQPNAPRRPEQPPQAQGEQSQTEQSQPGPSTGESPQTREDAREGAGDGSRGDRSPQSGSGGRGSPIGGERSASGARTNQPWAGRTRTVRPPSGTGGDGRVISEFFGPEGDRPAGARGGAGTASSAPGSLGEVLRESQRAAERSIENQSVPAEYTDLVRRVFRRYVERQPATAPAGQDARDATRKPAP